MQGVLQVSTDLVDPAQRTDYWRDVTRPLFDSLPCDSGLYPMLEGSYGTQMIGSVMTGYARFKPQRFIRDWRIISRSGLEDFYLLQMFAGASAMIDCAGTKLSVSGGDVYLFDFGRIFSSHYSAGSTYSLLLRRDRVEKVMNGRNLHGTLLKAGLPQTRLLSDIITGLASLTPAATDTHALNVEDAVISLLVLALHCATPAESDQVSAPILRMRVLDFIDHNLNDPSLDIPLLLSRFKVSRAHLYRMFETEGGIMRVIRERRLQAAYQQMMQRPVIAISQLAEHWGFAGSDQFQRSFRHYFGMTPNEVRHERAKLIVEEGRVSDIQDYLAGFATA